MKRRKKYMKSSGNIFADLGFANAEETLAKAEIARQIGIVIKAGNLSQIKIAEIIGIEQDKVLALLRGNLQIFSLKSLLGFSTSIMSYVRCEIPHEPNLETQKALHDIEKRKNLTICKK